MTALLATTEVIRVPFHLIHPDEAQVRRHFDEEALQQLAETIKLHDVIQPITLRELPAQDGDDEPRYQIVAGERRYRAAMMAGLQDIPAIIRTLSDDDASVLQVIENLQRRDLTLHETAAGVAKLESVVGNSRAAELLGMSAAWVSRYAAVMRLPEAVLRLVEDRKIESAEMASSLADMVAERPDHWRTADVLKLAEEGSLTRAALREQHRLLREEIERDRQYAEEQERARQKLLLPPEPPPQAEESERTKASAAAERTAARTPATEPLSGPQEAGVAPTPAASLENLRPVVSHTPWLSVTGRKACPFCASTKLHLITAVHEDNLPVTVECAQCGATGPVAKSGTEYELSRLWDHRPMIGEPPPLPELLTLRALVGVLGTAEKVTLTLSAGDTAGQYRAVFLAALGTEPLNLNDEAKRLRLLLAKPTVLRGSADSLDLELDAWLRGHVSERLEHQRRIDAIAAEQAEKKKAEAAAAKAKRSKLEAAKKVSPAKKPAAAKSQKSAN